MWWYAIAAVDEQGNQLPLWNLWRGRKKIFHNVSYLQVYDYVMIEAAGQDVYQENQGTSEFVREVRRRAFRQAARKAEA